MRRLKFVIMHFIDTVYKSHNVWIIFSRQNRQRNSSNEFFWPVHPRRDDELLFTGRRDAIDRFLH